MVDTITTAVLGMTLGDNDVIAPAPATTSSVINSNALAAREIEWAKNSEELIQEHQHINGSIVRTRFPPEPNGYLHMGHAKSINMNFSLAFDKLGITDQKNRKTIFRYDDTNPDAESQEYINSFVDDIKWLGFEPERTTYSSDNFQQLYDYAIQLIKSDKAYCCDMTKIEMENQRELAMKRVLAINLKNDPDVEAPIPSSDVLPGRNRNCSVERNLKTFEKMKLGLYEEGTWTLRLKMDFTSSNPNMYDLVAYRIRYTAHPAAAHSTNGGGSWCIYPNYDFTHGICDSLEHIDYSICTLEFETRREPYYWILAQLNMFRPNVYEMSRLNLQYTVLSKRRLLKLVQKGIVCGWDDCRMPTLSGYRRRGFTPEIITKFCNDLGATRAANVIEMEKLYSTARISLSTKTIRAMAVLQPIKVTITNWTDAVKESNEEGDKNGMIFEVQNSPTDVSMGSHTIEMTSTIYIDTTDFRLVDDVDYYGLAPNKAVGLKYYGGNLICDEIIYEDDDRKVIKELNCHLDNSVTRSKPKTWISWVPATATKTTATATGSSSSIDCEIRIYNHLFTVPEPTDLWEDEINSKSEIIYSKGKIDSSVIINDMCCCTKINRKQSNQAFQFERIGYFVVDYDSTYNATTGKGKLIFNRTVTLKEEVSKKKVTSIDKREVDANIARKLKQKQDLELKEARMKIEPKDLFRFADEYKGKYSKFDMKTGLPTHTIGEDGGDEIELTKSAIKKLKKEQDKHAKQLKKNQAQIAAGHK